MPSPTTNATVRPFARAAFSVVELLTVIAIIALVIAITLPALEGARNAGRRSATEGLLNNLANASATFQNDNNGRLPGVFDADEMGSDTNGGGVAAGANIAGLSAMENVLLALSGGGGAVISREAFEALPANEQAVYGPVYFSTALTGDTREVYVNPQLLGSDEGDYFRPPASFLTAQTPDGAGPAGEQVGQTGTLINVEATIAGNEFRLPDVVDAWGQPILVWAQDTQRVPRVESAQDFASISSSDGGTAGGFGPASLYYWNANAAFLRSPEFGRRGADMTLGLDSNAPVSLIGAGVVDAFASEVPDLLAALLGSPAYPHEPSLFGSDPYNATYPIRGRGQMIFQSAGADFVPFSTRDPSIARNVDGGALGIGGTVTLNLKYGINFATSTGDRHLDDNGSPATRDLAGDFDDILVTNN